MVLVEGGVGALWTPKTGTSLVDKTTEGFLEEACGPPAGRTGAGRRGRPGQVGVAVGDGRRQPWVLFPCYSIFHEDLPCPLNQTLTFESLGSLGGALRHAGSRALGSPTARLRPGGAALSKALPLAASRFPCLGREGAGDPPGSDGGRGRTGLTCVARQEPCPAPPADTVPVLPATGKFQTFARVAFEATKNGLP